MKFRHCHLAPALFGLLISIATPATAESITVYRDGGSDSPFPFDGPESGDPGELFNLDTDTGEESALQQLTIRTPGSFTAMARSADGTLYAILEEGRLVEIDETSGQAETVATLTDPGAVPEGYFEGPFAPSIPSVQAPAMAFVPAEEGEILYAIIKREEYYMEFPPSEEPDTGFLLVTIGETGEVTETGIRLQGQYDSRGHGLAWDPELHALVHFFFGYNEETENDEAVVAIIDPYEETVEVAYRSEDEDQSNPESFTGVAGLGESTFMTFDNRDSGFHFVVVEEDEGDFLFSIFPVHAEEEALHGEDEDGFTPGDYVYYGVRAMDLTADREKLLVELDGYLVVVELDGTIATEEPVLTSIGGSPAEVMAIFTDPTTGQIYALADADFEGRAIRIEEEERYESGLAIFAIDRTVPDEFELVQPVSRLVSEEYGLAYVDTVCFGPGGFLYGISDYEDLTLVRIDLATGEVVPVLDLDDTPLGDDGEDFQIAFDPEQGGFCVLYFDDDEEELALAQIGLDGNVSVTEVTGDFPNEMEPNGLAYVGGGTFLFTIDFYFGDFLLSLTKDGSAEILTVPPFVMDGPPVDVEDEPEYVTANLGFGALLTPTGALGLPDVSIGSSSRRLLGNNRYTRTGAGQVANVRERVERIEGSYYLLVENDGAYAADISLSGTTSKSGATFSYFANGKNVTATIRTGASVQFAPGEGADIRVDFVGRGRRLRTLARFDASYGSELDRGKASLNLKAQPKTTSGGPKPTGL